MNRFFGFVKWKAQYFYMFFVISMTAVTSAGFNSSDMAYKAFFLLGLIALGIKLLFTDWRLIEVVIGVVIGGLLAMNFLHNGEKTLIITYLAIIGVKNVDINKLLKWGLWVKVVATVAGLLMIVAGIKEYEIMELPKLLAGQESYSYLEIPMLGFNHPNAAFGNLLSIFMLALVVYREKVKWWMYILFTFLLGGAYWLLRCRTGILVWLVFVLIVLIYMVVRKTNVIRKIYEVSLCGVPMLIGAFTYVSAIFLHNEKYPFLISLNGKITGRISIWESYIHNGFNFLGGHVPAQPFDNAYMQCFYNYGLIIGVIFWGLYIYTMVYAIKKDNVFLLLYMAAIAVQSFMEFNMISVAWNLVIVYMGVSLFEPKNKID